MDQIVIENFQKIRWNSKLFSDTDHGLETLDRTIFDQKLHHWMKKFDRHQEPSWADRKHVLTRQDGGTSDQLNVWFSIIRLLDFLLNIVLSCNNVEPGVPSCLVNMCSRFSRLGSRWCSLFWFYYHLFLRILVTVKYR